MSCALCITFLMIIGTLLWLWMKKRGAYWITRRIPQVDLKFPLGILNGVGTKVHMSEVVDKIYADFKEKCEVVGVYFLMAPVLFVLNLDAVKNVLVKDFNNFADRGLYVNAKADPLSGHLFSIEGQEWRTMRNKLSPTFTSGKMKLMFSTVSTICNEMITFLNAQGEKLQMIEMKDILARYTTDVIGNVAFGLDLDSMHNPNSMFRVMGAKVFNPPPWQTIKIIFLTTFRKITQKFNFMVTQKDVSDFFLASIKDTVEYRETNKIERNDFLNLLMELKNHGKLKDENGEPVGKITLNELSAQAFLFFLAGFETSSTTMTFALYELSLNQEVQDQLRDEIKSILTKYGDQLTYEAMNEMKYLQMVLDETLRMYPPVDNLIRISAKDYTFPGTELSIEKDTLVFIPVHAIHNDPKNYENPKKFDPERFSEENKKNRHPMAHIPFGDGPRNCIGLRFGLMQAKIGLVKLLTNFKFLPSSRTPIPMVFEPKAQVLSPKGNMWLKVEKI